MYHTYNYLFSKIYPNCLKMLKDRGYKVTQKYKDIDSFKAGFVSDYLSITDEESKITTYISLKLKSFTSKDFKAIEKDIKNNNVYNILIIISISIGTIVNKFITKMYPTYRIRYMNINDLRIDLPSNELVPLHILINDEDEIKKVLSQLKFKKEDLPKTLESDPVARWYGAKVGDLFKIIRSNKKKKKNINDPVLNVNPEEIVYNEVIIGNGKI